MMRDPLERPQEVQLTNWEAAGVLVGFALLVGVILWVTTGRLW